MQNSDRTNKESIAQAYESPQFNKVLDEILHPGGLELTMRAAEVARTNPQSRILDISSGRGTTACLLAQEFGCRIAGVDISKLSSCLASHKAETNQLSHLTDFLAADAETFPFSDSSFDIVISECSFSLQLDKLKGACEIARILKPGGRFVLTDVVLKNDLSDELKTDLTFSCCFSGALTRQDYKDLFINAGLRKILYEDHSKAMKKITYDVITGYGSLSAFWQQFGSETSPCCPASEETGSSRNLWLRMFREGKPGYGLFCFEKPR